MPPIRQAARPTIMLPSSCLVRSAVTNVYVKNDSNGPLIVGIVIVILVLIALWWFLFAGGGAQNPGGGGGGGGGGSTNQPQVTNPAPAGS
jgi:hypothetical protein